MNTIFSLIPITGKAREWVKNNINAEKWQRFGEAVVIEHGFINDIVEGMKESGLKLQTDFIVE